MLILYTSWVTRLLNVIKSLLITNISLVKETQTSSRRLASVADRMREGEHLEYGAQQDTLLNSSETDSLPLTVFEKALTTGKEGTIRRWKIIRCPEVK